MNLYELSYACNLYNTFTTFGKTYGKLCKIIGDEINLDNADHRLFLIRWLNEWGCRQFSHECHNEASLELLAWFQEGYVNHISSDQKLWELTESDFEEIARVYDELSRRIASTRLRNGKRLVITFGPTGASKILFVLRPDIAVPWDEAMRKGLQHSGDGASYAEYLKRVVSEIHSLDHSCRKHSIEMLDLLQLLDRNEATIPQLIGEYFWVTETRKCYPPPSNVIRNWAKWADG